jgi:hypothetical protein
MNLFKFLIPLFLFNCFESQAESYYAQYGDHYSGSHASASSACMALGSIIYPNFYAHPITGVKGIVDADHFSTCSAEKSETSTVFVGHVYWSEEICNNPDELGRCLEEITLCEDALPEIIGDYISCDRPNLKLCTNGLVIESESETCETVCTDYDTCQAYAQSNFSTSCNASTIFEFQYTNPDNWTYSCTTIEDLSPDHAENGGNEDGNINNDPSSPTSPTVSELDVESLAIAIDSELQNDFGNIERSIRDGIESAEGNTSKLIDELKTISSTLSNISESTNTDTYTIPQSSPAAVTIEMANQNFYSRISSSPIAGSFSNINNLISLNESQCPIFEIELSAPINSTISTQIHCDLYQTIRPILSPVMMAIWVFVGFRIFAST